MQIIRWRARQMKWSKLTEEEIQPLVISGTEAMLAWVIAVCYPVVSHICCRHAWATPNLRKEVIDSTWQDARKKKKKSLSFWSSSYINESNLSWINDSKIWVKTWQCTQRIEDLQTHFHVCQHFTPFNGCTENALRSSILLVGVKGFPILCTLITDYKLSLSLHFFCYLLYAVCHDDIFPGLICLDLHRFQ